ncbi:MAG: recombinase family protein [Chloroflexi bacterium]|nr:recombinase family protein [Chloroflexota bacterium]
MRALGYFTVRAGDPRADGILTEAFERFCSMGSHLPQGVFRDEPGSPGAESRPGWDALMNHIQRTGLGYLVVVPGAAHLGSSLSQQVRRVLEIDALACTVVCDDEEKPDPLQNAIAALDRGASTRGEQIREGMKAKAAKGLGLGRPPFGYRLQVDGTLRVDPDEAEVVRSMFRMYTEPHQGVRAVAQRLNEAGATTRLGGRWSLVTVRDILRNSAYIGTYHRFGLRIPGTYEPIVDAASFHAAQEQMRSRSPVRRNPRAEPFPLAGVLHCGHCGQRMIGVVRHRSWKRKGGGRGQRAYRYYQCQTRINEGGCAYRTIRADDLEATVLGRLRDLTPEGKVLPRNPSSGAPTTAPTRSRTSAGALDRRLADLVRRTADGGMSLAQLRVGMAEIEAARDALGGGGPEAERLDARAAAEEARDKLHYLWDDMDSAERQGTVRALTERVTLTDGEAEVELR